MDILAKKNANGIERDASAAAESLDVSNCMQTLMNVSAAS
jgi:hypothetical protein